MRFGVFGSMLAISLFLLGSGGRADAQAVDFSQDVRPILSQHCFKCHGPDDKQRMAGLRLDDAASAYRMFGGGKRAVVPGKPEQSVLVARIRTNGPGLMPPAYTNKPLSEAEKKVLERWIKSGAVYRPHWAFVPPKQAALPAVKQTDWPRNPIDRFILASLEKNGLHPSPEADRYTLIRRVSLDLIGLPPTLEETDAFVNDRRPDAYERLVDRLLASPHYGERWAERWLDLARYADTNGYEKDRERSIWPYRDWVINALNRDMPFDQFTIAQLAGDMLPSATPEQRIATGFHRNTMLNEEGGIDPQEYRFYAMVDRTATTGTAWMGLTLGCAQCHTHKYDPITQKEYYRMMAFLDNADEPEIEVPRPDIAEQRKSLEAKIAWMEKDLPNRFPTAPSVRWTPVTVVRATSESGATLETLPDGSVRVSGPNPDADTYTVIADSTLSSATRLRIEALTDSALGNGGPGRTPHGNFVLTEFAATAGADANVPGKPVLLTHPEADFAQADFPAAATLDEDAKTGWAIQGPGNWNQNRTLTFRLDPSQGQRTAGRWKFRLAQTYGGKHTLGRFRISLGVETPPDNRPEEVQRKERFEAAFAAWRKESEKTALQWTVLHPTKAVSNAPRLTILDDDSVLSSGDITKRDLYTLDFKTDLSGITAIRLEALPDPSLPHHGPGRIYYEGSPGGFFLSEITLEAGGVALPFSHATQSEGSAANAMDGSPQTGWAISGGQEQTQTAFFTLAQPLAKPTFTVRLLFEQYYAAALGRFRISVTTDPRTSNASLTPDVEAILRMPEAQRNVTQQERLREYFAATTPELQTERDAIQHLREQMPAYPTTLVFAERPADNPRQTHVHHRGEYLQTEDIVTPGVLAFLPPLPPGQPANRLTFARWLVDGRNPLVGRVAVNRQWAAFFGRGIVSTIEDFGYQGQPPSHPELLDWLAVELVRQGWSIKKLQRLLVTSATYRQSARLTPEQKLRDPQNRLLSHAPRFRLEAELTRDAALTASGLLSPKIGGPGVFPPQPPGVTSEGTYGALQWNVSAGEDRYRRGLYTFRKRTAPYAMFATFDAPSGEACLARREVSNTPLQALALLNDTVFVDAAQALGRMLTAQQGSLEERVTLLFRRCVTRPPTDEERTLLVQFYTAQHTRFAGKELDALAVAGAGAGDATERAAWTALARSLLNLDEAITRQ